MGTGAYHGTLRAKVFTHSAVECVAGALVALVVVVAVCHDGGLFRAFGEASVHGLCDNLALGNTALSQGKRAVAWGPHALTLFQRPPGVGGQFLPPAGTTTVGPSCAASWPARHRSSIPTRGARVTGAS